MVMHDSLYLYEEIMLLALKDDAGTVVSGTLYQYAIGGAILAELLLEKRITIEESKKKLVNIVNTTPIGDNLIDECLDRMCNAKRRASLQTWVSRFAGVKQLKHRAAQQLCRRGILRADEDKVLKIFTRKIYPEMNPEPEKRLIERLREAIFTDTQDIEPRTVVLVSLSKSADLLKTTFDKKLLKGRKERLEQIINGEVTGKATKDAIQAMQSAVMVACIMPAIVATTVSH